MKKLKYKIVFSGKAFDRQGNANRINPPIKNYNQKVKEMDKLVDELDRFDDFDTLKIPMSVYEKQNDEIYGIPRKPEHKDTVIFKHQEAAAKKFLRELRGFGLLADVVGSGKTYEAGVVISELAIRNQVRSMLFIVPKQAKSDWIRVMERCFGMGDGCLYQAGPEFNPRDLNPERMEEYILPRKPIIVTFEDFVQWGEECTNYLFDVIVVDEAHHLCAEEGKYSKAMKTLSQMVELKRRVKSSYCLLLSATPHSGNLEKMFRLWYFVRCTGGKPSDYDEKDDKYRTPYYLEEKEHYKKFVCKNATTVMEFINNAKLEEVTNQNNFPKFTEYLKKNGLYAIFMQANPQKKDEIIKDYLNSDYEIKEEIYRSVARAYHSGVLRSIMIRQPNAELITKKKNVYNYLFFKTHHDIPRVVSFRIQNIDVTVNVSDINSNQAIYYDREYYSLESFANEYKGNQRYQDFYSELIRNIIIEVDNIDNDKNPFFVKKHSLRYYTRQIQGCPKEVHNQIHFMKTDEDDNFDHKFEATLDLLEKHKNERIIVFFDYELKRQENVVDRFVREMKNSKFGYRLLQGTVAEKQEIEDKFNANEDAVLVVTDMAFTESVNWQCANIIINFQVITDPVAMDQRIGRVFRLGQKNDVSIYNLADMNRLEGYALMYLSRIGLLTSNSGDATILAGSNSEKMLAIRCKRCKRVEFISESEYKERKENKQLYCETPSCKKYNEELEVITVTDFKCDRCGKALIRSDEDEGYECWSIPGYGNKKGILENSGLEKDRVINCRKNCAMINCSKLREIDCQVVQALLMNKNTPTSTLIQLCSRCTSQSSCPEKCRPGKPISGCVNCRFAQCEPKPHYLRFNEKWEAQCPSCSNHSGGILKPVVPSTFASYVNNAWAFNRDNGESFCGILLKEADKVEEIKIILEMDDVLEEN